MHTFAISYQCGIKIATKKLKMTETFMTTVDELFLTLTQKERVSAWSRGEVKAGAAVGSKMVLFDKNIEGNADFIIIFNLSGISNVFSKVK